MKLYWAAWICVCWTLGMEIGLSAGSENVVLRLIFTAASCVVSLCAFAVWKNSPKEES